MNSNIQGQSLEMTEISHGVGVKIRGGEFQNTFQIRKNLLNTIYQMWNSGIGKKVPWIHDSNWGELTLRDKHNYDNFIIFEDNLWDCRRAVLKIFLKWHFRVYYNSDDEDFVEVASKSSKNLNPQKISSGNSLMHSVFPLILLFHKRKIRVHKIRVFTK